MTIQSSSTDSTQNAAGITIYLPPHGLTFPVLEHPSGAEIEKQVNHADWPYILEFFCSKKAAEAYIATNMPSFGTLTYPNARRDRLFFIAQTMDLMTLMDEEFARPKVIASHELTAELRAHYLAALDGIEPPEKFPLARLLLKSFQSIMRDINPRVGARLKQAITEQIQSLASDHRPTIHSFADFEAYLTYRRRDIFAEWAIVLTEYGINADMTDALLDQDLRRATQYALDTVTLANDLYSFSREVSAHDSLNAIWLLLEGDLETGLQSAIERLVEILNHRERQFLASREKVVAGSMRHQEDVHRYLTELGHFSSGNAEFHLRSLRYHGGPDGQIFSSGDIVLGTSVPLHQIATANPGT